MFFYCQENIDFLKKEMHNNADIVHKIIFVKNTKIGIFYVKTLIDEKLLSSIVFEPFTKCLIEEVNSKSIVANILNTADMEVVENATTKKQDDQIILNILKGQVAIFVEGENSFILVDVKNFPARNPEEPPTSAVIYGPRVGFTESIETNLAMIRKKLPTKNFAFKDFIVGKYTQTKIFLTYIDGIADIKIVNKIAKKIEAINIDGVVDSYYIISFLKKDNYIFKQVGVAEKPDVITAKMLEGRIAILVDGSPIVLTIPFMVFEDIQNSNDYYTNNVYTTFIRIIRLLGILVSTVAPGIYLSLRLYHYKILPLKFLITISNTTEGLPFTPFVELIFILVLFQILYEVSMRLPRYLSLATSIVGALILGQTGVNAGLISPPGVVIIAVSIIAIYTVSDQAPQLTILRALFLLIGGTIGILGIVGTLVFLVDEMATINNYGVPYLSPYAPRIKQDLKDGVFKKSTIEMNTRPKSLNNKNVVRLKNDREN
ncbi:MAG: spore germination protein [Clostridia bacterium]|nr:spore germination protein [Clostridia bacterium]